MWVQCVCVWIIFFVVGLVYALKLTVALSYASNRLPLWLRFRTSIKFEAFVLENEDHAVSNTEELWYMIEDVWTLFELKVEFDYIEVANELLDLTVAALIHFKDRGLF